MKTKAEIATDFILSHKEIDLDAWSEITHAMAILHESLDIAQEDID